MIYRISWSTSGVCVVRALLALKCLRFVAHACIHSSVARYVQRAKRTCGCSSVAPYFVCRVSLAARDICSMAGMSSQKASVACFTTIIRHVGFYWTVLRVPVRAFDMCTSTYLRRTLQVNNRKPLIPLDLEALQDHIGINYF